MSDRFDTLHPDRQPRRSAVLAAIVALAGLACGLLATAGTAAGEDPLKPRDKDPLPNDTPRRPPHEKFAVDRSLAVFDPAAIKDYEKVASEAVRPPEYRAWVALVQHANQFATADLEAHAARDLVPADLIRTIRFAFRFELIRFDGKLNCARWLDAPDELKQAGIEKLYEVRLVPLDESPLTPVSVVFTQLPPALAGVQQKKSGEWLDLDGWATAAGFYFKTMNVPGEHANSVIGVPVLVGKSVTPVAGPPAPYGTNPAHLDKNVRVYRFITDKTEMRRTAPTDSTWPEVAAYHRIVLHASRFSPAELEENARTDLRFVDLFEETRNDYRLDLVKLEGRLISLRRLETNDLLRAAGVNTLYEGWMVPKGQPQGLPVCIVFTAPVEGLDVEGRVNKWVSFAGYSFKLMRYESGEKDPKDESKYLDKYAPLLIGHSPIVRPDPDKSSSVTWGLFFPIAATAIGALLVGGLALGWWFRRGDRKVKREAEAIRGQNPFDPAGPRLAP